MKNRVKHGLSKHKLYKTWGNIIQRCKSNKFYENINICNEWRYSFVSFYNWSMSNGYKEGLTIDRIDNLKGYNPENCRYVTMCIQNMNKRSNKSFNYKGEELKIKEIVELTGINRNTFNKRIRLGWSVEDAANKEVDERFRFIKTPTK